MRRCNCPMSQISGMMDVTTLDTTTISSDSVSAAAAAATTTAHVHISKHVHSHTHGQTFGYGFYTWFEEQANSKTSLPPMVLGVLCMAFIAEGLGAFHAKLRVKPLFWISSRCVTLTAHNILATLVHAAKMTLMFFLMVIFMSLNPWMCSAIVVGNAVGHLAFKWKLSWESESPEKEDESLRSHW